MSIKVEQRYVCDVLRSANDTANWGRARALYEQCKHIRGSQAARRVPEVLRDEFAECLSEIAVSYNEREELFIDHALAVFAEVDNRETFNNELFVAYYHDGTNSGERTPSSVETVVETCRRQRDLRRIDQALAGTDTSGILCGSMSYGPYYNVRGHHDDEPASDLDLIIVSHDTAQIPAIAERLSGLSGVDQATVDRFRGRTEIFNDHYDDGKTILSHKITMWTNDTDSALSGTGLRGDYQVSLHLLTLQTLGYNLVESSTMLTRATAGGIRTVRDYRDTRTSRADLPRTFAGREYPVAPQPIVVEEGWLRSMTAYMFDETDSYCPGFLQTILLPVPDLRWDELGVRANLAAFVRKFHDRYRHEKARNSQALLLPSFAHVRGDAFAPHVLRRFDGEV